MDPKLKKLLERRKQESEEHDDYHEHNDSLQSSQLPAKKKDKLLKVLDEAVESVIEEQERNLAGAALRAKAELRPFLGAGREARLREGDAGSDLSDILVDISSSQDESDNGRRKHMEPDWGTEIAEKKSKHNALASMAQARLSQADKLRESNPLARPLDSVAIDVRSVFDHMEAAKTKTRRQDKSHDALASMAEARLSHSSSKLEGVDTSSLFDRRQADKERDRATDRGLGAVKEGWEGEEGEDGEDRAAESSMQSLLESRGPSGLQQSLRKASPSSSDATTRREDFASKLSNLKSLVTKGEKGEKQEGSGRQGDREAEEEGGERAGKRAGGEGGEEESGVVSESIWQTLQNTSRAVLEDVEKASGPASISHQHLVKRLNASADVRQRLTRQFTAHSGEQLDDASPDKEPHDALASMAQARLSQADKLRESNPLARPLDSVAIDVRSVFDHMEAAKTKTRRQDKSHDALASMAEARLSHSSSKLEGVDTSSLFDRRQADKERDRATDRGLGAVKEGWEGEEGEDGEDRAAESSMQSLLESRGPSGLQQSLRKASPSSSDATTKREDFASKLSNLKSLVTKGEKGEKQEGSGRQGDREAEEEGGERAGKRAGGEGGEEESGVVSESIWSSMWAGQVQAKRDEVLESYKRGKLQEQDLKRLKVDDSKTAETYRESVERPSPLQSRQHVAPEELPSEDRALNFKIAKLEKKKQKAEKMNDSKKARMYGLEIQRLRNQLQGIEQDDSDEYFSPLFEEREKPPAGFGSKLAQFKDMLAMRRKHEMIRKAPSEASSKTQVTEKGAIEEEEVCGVGLRLNLVGHKFVVLAILAGTSADKSGISIGDVVTRVDGASTAGWTMEMMSSKLRGRIGTQVSVSMQDGREFVLTRTSVSSLLKDLEEALHPQTWIKESDRLRGQYAQLQQGDLPVAIEEDEDEEGDEVEPGDFVRLSRSAERYEPARESADEKRRWSFEFDAHGAADIWSKPPARHVQESMTSALASAMNAMRQHGGAEFSSGMFSVKSGGDMSKASMGIGQLLSRSRQKAGSLLGQKPSRSSINHDVLYAGVQLSEIESLPRKTAKSVALERIRKALRSIERQNEAALRSRYDWSLEEEEEILNETLPPSNSRAQESGDREDTWCLVLCCKLVRRDLAACWQDMFENLQCRSRPTLRCVMIATCSAYCALIAAGVLALLYLVPVTTRPV